MLQPFRSSKISSDTGTKPLEFFRFCDKIVSTHNQLCIIEVRDIINDDYYYDYYQSDDDYDEKTKISNSNDVEKDYPTKISGKKI